MTDDPITIGTRLWQFDENRRRYAPGSMGPPIYEEHFTPGVITGEARGTWIVDGRCRVNKRTLREPMRGGFDGARWFTDAGRDANIWAHSRRHQIAEAVRRCDVPTLKKIAAILEEAAR